MTTTDVPHTAPSGLTGATVIRKFESPRIEYVELDGETVVYEALRNRLHLLDAAATIVWRLLDGTTSLDAASQMLAEALDRPAGEVFEDVRSFAEHLERIGIAGRVG